MALVFNGVDRLMRSGVDQRVFPGAVLRVVRQGQVVFSKAYGWADLFSGRPMTIDTVFDLASLTKPLATTLVVMDLIRRGLWDLDRPLGERWSWLNADKHAMTIRHLLCHRSGLPPWRPYFMRLRLMDADARFETLRRWLVQEPLAYAPGHHSAYSDLGFLLLQWLIEQTVGRRLDRQVTETIYRPLGIDSLFFIDLAAGAPELAYAATELCFWRNRLLVGQVHDDNAHVLGGVAGHAGLFGTAAGVGALLLALLAAGQVRGSHLWMDRAIINIFFQIQPGGTWALGFDTPAPRDSSAGRLFSAGSVGHLGYTGTSFWMDRQSDIVVILLTNRVHPSRCNENLRAFRPRLHDAVLSAIRNADR